MPRRFSDEEARRLWERATQLQAEAARRRETLPAGDGGSGDDGDDDEASQGYAVEHVRQAALEAGIDPEFMDQALAEARSGMLPAPSQDTSFADRFLGDGAHWLVAREEVELSVRECLDALRRVFPRLGLNLVDSRGGRPEKGGVLVFEAGNLAATMSNKTLMQLSYASVSEIHASFHALPGDDEGCRVVLKAPLVKQRRTSAQIGLPSVLVTGAGVCAAAMAVAVSALGAGGLTGIETIMGVGAGMGGGGVAGVGMHRVWRWMQRYGQDKAQEGLDRLLQMVVTDARTEGGFAPAESDDGTGLGDTLGLSQFGI
jgi:hypothetical protein